MSIPSEQLFEPLQRGAIEVSNRVFMAPLTRNRANHDGDVPTHLNVRYYEQRATAGLIVTEGTQVSPNGCVPVRRLTFPIKQRSTAVTNTYPFLDAALQPA